MKFRFRLDQAMRLLEIEERKKKIELGKLIGRVSEMAMEIERIRKDRRALLKLSIGPAVSTQWLGYQSEQIEGDRQNEERLSLNLSDVRGLLVQKRSELAATLLKRKAYENKRTADYKEFRMKQARTLQQRLDDNQRILKAGERRKG